MNRIKRLNNYAICSGGYITDVLDRRAQEHLIKHEPQYTYWLTASAKIEFLRQTDGTRPTFTTIRSKISIFKPNTASVRVVLWDSTRGAPIAVGKFKFVGKTKLAIKPKGKQQ